MPIQLFPLIDLKEAITARRPDGKSGPQAAEPLGICLSVLLRCKKCSAVAHLSYQRPAMNAATAVIRIVASENAVSPNVGDFEFCRVARFGMRWDLGQSFQWWQRHCQYHVEVHRRSCFLAPCSGRHSPQPQVWHWREFQGQTSPQIASGSNSNWGGAAHDARRWSPQRALARGDLFGAKAMPEPRPSSTHRVAAGWRRMRRRPRVIHFSWILQGC